MLNKNDVRSVFKASRIIIYITTLLVYIYCRYFFNRDTLCNHGYTCPLCGMRTAMYYIECGRLSDAFHSNKMCILVVLFFAVAILDSLLIVKSHLKQVLQ